MGGILRPFRRRRVRLKPPPAFEPHSVGGGAAAWPLGGGIIRRLPGGGELNRRLAAAAPPRHLRRRKTRPGDIAGLPCARQYAVAGRQLCWRRIILRIIRPATAGGPG